MKSADPNVALTRAVRNNRRVLSRRVAALLNSVSDTKNMSEVQATINELERAYLNAARHEAARAFDELGRQGMLRRVVFPKRELGISFVLARFELMDDGSIISGGDISSDSALSRRLVVVEKTFSNRGDGIGHRLLCPTDELLGIRVNISGSDDEALPKSSDYDLIVDPSVEDFAKLLHRLRDATRPVCLCFALGPQREAARNSMLAAEERARRKESGNKTDQVQHTQVEREKVWPGNGTRQPGYHQQHASDQLEREAKPPELTANSSPPPAGSQSARRPARNAHVEHHEHSQHVTEVSKCTQMVDVHKAKREDALMAEETVLIAQAAIYKRLEEAERDERLRLLAAAGARVDVNCSEHAPLIVTGTAATDREELSLRAQAEAKMMEEQRRLTLAGDERRVEASRHAAQFDALEIKRKTAEAAPLILKDAKIRRQEKKCTVQSLEENVCWDAQGRQANAIGRAAHSATEETDAGEFATDKCQLGLRHDEHTELTRRKHRIAETKAGAFAAQQALLKLNQTQLRAAAGLEAARSSDTRHLSRLNEEQASKSRLIEARRRRCQIQEQLHDQEAARQAVAEANRYLTEIEYGSRQPTHLFNADKNEDLNDTQGYETVHSLKSDDTLFVARTPAPSASVSQQENAVNPGRAPELTQATRSKENVATSATNVSDEGRLKLEDLEGSADNEDVVTLEPPSWSPAWRGKAIEEATPPLWHLEEGRNTQSSAQSLELALENLRERVELLEGKSASADEAPNQVFLRDALREVSARLDSRRHLDDKTRSPMLEREIRELLADARRRVDDLEARKRQPLAITEVDGGLDSRADDGSLFFRDECTENVIAEVDDMVPTIPSAPQSHCLKVQPVLKAANPSNTPSKQPCGSSSAADPSVHHPQSAYKHQNDSNSANGEVQLSEEPNDVAVTPRTLKALDSSASGKYQMSIVQKECHPGQATLQTDIEHCNDERRRELRSPSQTIQDDAAPLAITELEYQSEPVVDTSKLQASVQKSTLSGTSENASPFNNSSSVGLQTDELIATPSSKTGNLTSRRHCLVRRSGNGFHVSTQTDFDQHGAVMLRTHSTHGNALMTTSTTVKMSEAGPSKCSNSATTQVQTISLHKLTSSNHAPIGFSSKTIIKRNTTTAPADPALVRNAIAPATIKNAKVGHPPVDERISPHSENSRSSGLSRQTSAKKSTSADQKGRVISHEVVSSENPSESPSIRTHIHVRRTTSATPHVGSQCSTETISKNEEPATRRVATFRFETVTPTSGSTRPVAAQAGASAGIPPSSNSHALSTRTQCVYKTKGTAAKRDCDMRAGRTAWVSQTVICGPKTPESQSEARSGNLSFHLGHSTRHDSAVTIVHKSIPNDIGARRDFDSSDPGTMRMQAGATRESFYPHGLPSQLEATTERISRVSTAKREPSFVHEVHGDALSRAQALYPQVRPEILMASYPSTEKVHKDHESVVARGGTRFSYQTVFDDESDQVLPANEEFRCIRDDDVQPAASHLQPARGRQAVLVRPTSRTRSARSHSTPPVSHTAEERSIAAGNSLDNPNSSNRHQSAPSAHEATENVLDRAAKEDLPQEAQLDVLQSPRHDEGTTVVGIHRRPDTRSEPRCTTDRGSRSRSFSATCDGRLRDFAGAFNHPLPRLGSRSLSPRRTSARVASIFGDKRGFKSELLHSPRSHRKRSPLSLHTPPATSDEGVSSGDHPMNSTRSSYSELSLESGRRLSFPSPAQLSELPRVDHVAMPAIDRHWSASCSVLTTAQLDSSLQEYDQPLDRPADWRKHDELRSVVEREDTLDAREISRTYDERVEYLHKMQRLRRDRLVAAEAAASAREALDTAAEFRTLEKEAVERSRLRREQAAREAEVREREHLARERMIRERDKAAAQRAVADALVEIERHKRVRELIVAVRHALQEARRARIEATQKATRAAEAERARRMYEFSMQVDAAAVETRTRREASIALAKTAFETEQKRAIAAYEGNMARDNLALLAQRAHDTKLAIAYAEAERARRLSEEEAAATNSTLEREEARRWVNEAVEIERANRIAQAAHCDEHAELERDNNRSKAVELAEAERASRVRLLLTEPYMRPWPISCICRVDDLTRREIAATNRKNLQQIRDSEVALRSALVQAQNERDVLAARMRDAESLHAETVDCVNGAKRDASLWQQQALDLMEQIEDVKRVTAMESEMFKTKLATSRAETENVRRSGEDKVGRLQAELATAQAALKAHQDAEATSARGLIVPIQNTLLRARTPETEMRQSTQPEREGAHKSLVISQEDVANGAGKLEDQQTAPPAEECAEGRELVSVGTVASTETGTLSSQLESTSESINTATVSSHIASDRDKREKQLEQALTELRATSDAALAALQNELGEERRMRNADVSMLKRDFDEAQALLSRERDRHSNEEKRLRQEINTIQTAAADKKEADDLIRTELHSQIELARMTVEDFEARAKDTSENKAIVCRLEAELASAQCALERLQTDGQNDMDSLRADLAEERDQRERELLEGKRHLASAQSEIEELRLQLSSNEEKLLAIRSDSQSHQIADNVVESRDAQTLTTNSIAVSLESSGETQDGTVSCPASADSMQAFHLNTKPESALQSMEGVKEAADESVSKLQRALDIAEATSACNDAAKWQERKARSDAENREAKLRLELEASRKVLDAAQAKAAHEVASLTSQIEAQKALFANFEEKQQDAGREGLKNEDTDVVARREHEIAAYCEEIAGLKAELVDAQELINEQKKLRHERMTNATLMSKTNEVETEHDSVSPFLEKKGVTATVNAAARAVADAERRALVAERQAKQYQDELASAMSAHDAATRSWHEQTRRHTRELELARDKEALVRSKLKESRLDDAVTAELIATKLELASTRMEMDALQQTAARTSKQLAALSQSQPPKSGVTASSRNKRRQ